MKWIKKGLIFNPEGKFSWADNTALQPTPLLCDDKIRVFAGFRDKEGISRIGWVDLNLSDPSKVIGYSPFPALDLGLPGSFDDNGVVPTAVVRRGEEIYLYYAGYQLVKNVRFIAFCGLAISIDGGSTFKRYSNTPIMDRTHDEFLFRVVHTIIYDKGVWKAWYGGGSHFVSGAKKSLPIYDIRYIESEDGINFPTNGKTVLTQKDGEYRVGRPFVILENGIYRMFFGGSTQTEPYRLAYAESTNGENWVRMDSDLNMSYDSSEFDSEMSAYPSVIRVNGQLIMFYNGNNYGYEGFGMAILEE